MTGGSDPVYRPADEGGEIAFVSERTALHRLGAAEYAHWHRLDADEVWTHRAGAPLALTLSPDGHDAEAHRLGARPETGERTEIAVPAGWWRTAETLGAGTLVERSGVRRGLERAAEDWFPKPRRT